MTRRDDIQGLRALAVAMVIFFHLGLPGFAGGFVGVDVFFVISGFLITRKLYDDLEDGDVVARLLGFWGARVKRLLPNGLLALLFAIAVGLLFLPFYRAREVSFDAAMAAAFIANVHFAQTAADYFQHSDPPSLVLHFWSLSVEEQFYALLPLGIALAGLARQRRKFLVNLLLTFILVASFGWAQQAIHVSEPSAFYLLQNRAWQFAVGGLLGVNFEAVQRIPARVKTIGSLAGLLLIAIAVESYGNVIYPGLWAIVPTLGAALVLAEEHGPVSRTLAAKPAVWVGDRSYSLYLWHWPLLALCAERFEGNFGANLVAIAIGVLLALAAYRWVERPFTCPSSPSEHHSSGFRAELWESPPLQRSASASARSHRPLTSKCARWRLRRRETTLATTTEMAVISA